MVTDASQLPGIDPSWVRTYHVERNGVSETFAVLENAPGHPVGTILCVHGDPTWSYLWRNFVRELGASWRIIAIDQLGMGFSSRSLEPRTLSTRIADLDSLLTAANVHGPVTLIAHDWGGPVSLGWASQHPERVENLVLFNTGTTIPTTGVPGLIQVSRTPLLRRIICSQTKAFILVQCCQQVESHETSVVRTLPHTRRLPVDKPSLILLQIFPLRVLMSRITRCTTWQQV